MLMKCAGSEMTSGSAREGNEGAARDSTRCDGVAETGRGRGEAAATRRCGRNCGRRVQLSGGGGRDGSGERAPCEVCFGEKGRSGSILGPGASPIPLQVSEIWRARRRPDWPARHPRLTPTHGTRPGLPKRRRGISLAALLSRPTPFRPRRGARLVQAARCNSLIGPPRLQPKPPWARRFHASQHTTHVSLLGIGASLRRLHGGSIRHHSLQQCLWDALDRPHSPCTRSNERAPNYPANLRVPPARETIR